MPFVVNLFDCYVSFLLRFFDLFDLDVAIPDGGQGFAMQSLQSDGTFAGEIFQGCFELVFCAIRVLTNAASYDRIGTIAKSRDWG